MHSLKNGNANPGKPYRQCRQAKSGRVAEQRLHSTKDHGESYEYRGGPLDRAPLEAGERRVLIYDMVNQAAGAPDWMENVVTQLRFDLPQGSNSSYIVHSIRLCPAQLADCS